MPITKVGKQILKEMESKYGAEKGKGVFFGSIVKGKAGSSKWHGKKKGGTLAKAKRTYQKVH